MTNGEKLCLDFPDVTVRVIKDDVGSAYIEVEKDDEWVADFDVSWWNATYKEPTTKELQAESDKFDAAFQDGYSDGYAQAKFDYEQEPTTESGISNKSIIYKAKESKEIQEDLDKLSKLNESTTKSETLVSLDVYNQVAKERNIAIQQLHELGYEFGQKIEPSAKNDLGVDSTPNTISFKGMMDNLKITAEDIENAEDLEYSIEPLIHPKNDLGVDCISREAVLEQAYAYGNGLEPDGYCVNVEDIQTLPSVIPIRPKGHWIANAPQYDMLNPQFICSECGNAHTRTTPYCEMCGAKMDKEDNYGR